LFIIHTHQVVRRRFASSYPVSSRSFSAAVQEAPLLSDLSASYIELEEKYGAHNYHPLPVVLSKGLGEYCFRFVPRYNVTCYAGFNSSIGSHANNTFANNTFFLFL